MFSCVNGANPHNITYNTTPSDHLEKKEKKRFSEGLVRMCMCVCVCVRVRVHVTDPMSVCVSVSLCV